MHEPAKEQNIFCKKVKSDKIVHFFLSAKKNIFWKIFCTRVFACEKKCTKVRFVTTSTFWKIVLDSNRGLKNTKILPSSVFRSPPSGSDSTLRWGAFMFLRGACEICVWVFCACARCAHPPHATRARHGGTHRRDHAGFCGFLTVEICRWFWTRPHNTYGILHGYENGKLRNDAKSRFWALLKLRAI